ncbi:MAG: FtsX-like permease family protein [Actinomycetota bacterium]
MLDDYVLWGLAAIVAALIVHTLVTGLGDKTVRRLSFRNIRASVGRLILTTIAVTAGVAFVSGSFILTDSLSATFDELFANSTNEIDAQVQVAELEFGQDERTIPDTLIAEVDALPEVDRAIPTVQLDPGVSFRPYILIDETAEPSDDGSVSTIEPAGGPIIAFSWDGEDSEALSLAEGAPPNGPDQIAIDTTYADAYRLITGEDIVVGESYRFQTDEGEQTFVVSGIGELPITAGAFFVFFDFETGQQQFDKVGQVDVIALTRASGVSTAEMIAAVETVLPEEAEVLDRTAIIDQANSEFETFFTIFRNVLLGFALVALFVSLFIIYNTFAILVTQRLRQFGMLRAVGSTRGQIRSLVQLEALIVGVIGSLLGIIGGLGVAWLIKTGLNAAGGFPDTGTVLELRTVWIALIVGLGATLISALLPALMAGRVSPIAAMRNEAPSAASINRQVIIGAVVLGVGLIVLGFGLFSSGQSATTVITLLGVGSVLTFIGVALLSAIVAGPFVEFVGRPYVLGGILFVLGVGLPLIRLTVGDGLPDTVFSWVGFTVGTTIAAIAAITGFLILASAISGRSIGFGGSAAGLAGRMARRNAARSPQRTAATATALTIGIALVAAAGVVAESLKASVAATFEQAIQADLFLFDEETNSPFSSQVAAELSDLDGIAEVSGLRANEVRLGVDADGEDDIVDVVAYNAATGENLFRLGVSEGDTSGLVSDGVLVLDTEAEARGLSVGDTLDVEFPDLETETLTVSGLFTDDRLFPETPLVIDLSVYERHVATDDDLFVLASIEEGADPEAVKESAIDLAGQFASVTAQDNRELLETQESQVDGLVTVINYLLGFALVVAFLGVINTIVLSVVERTREIGLLRAVGTTRQQISSTIRWEAMIVSLFGAALGLVVGVLFAWAAVTAIPDSFIDTIAIPYETVMLVIITAALAGVVAAVIPAIRASRLNVLQAISQEI